MAKATTSKRTPTPAKRKPAARPKAPRTGKAKSGPGAADALLGLLQSPLVAELLAAAAAAAIASLASSKKGGGKAAVKAAGAAAATAIGQRLTSEIGAIRKTAKSKTAKS